MNDTIYFIFIGAPMRNGNRVQNSKLKLEPQGALIAHLSTMSTSVIS